MPKKALEIRNSTPNLNPASDSDPNPDSETDSDPIPNPNLDPDPNLNPDPDLIPIPILSHTFTTSYDFKSPLVECANKLAQILLGLSNLTGGDGKMMMQHSSRAVGTNRDMGD